jgi:drug/metabolite transporter (DMT)-like permease
MTSSSKQKESYPLLVVSRDNTEEQHQETTQLLNSRSGSATLPKKQQDVVVIQPTHHSLLGLGYVATSAFCFSLMSTFIKYATSTMTSMEAIFWRSFVAMILNLVCNNEPKYAKNYLAI